MARVCQISGAHTSRGNRIRYRGKAKYLGGIGKKVTSISPREFKPNLQTVRALVDGRATRVRVSARVIKTGLITKPPRRKYVYTANLKRQQQGR